MRLLAIWIAALYLAIFEQGGSAEILSLITGGGRDDTSKSVIIIVNLSNLWGGNCPLLGMALDRSEVKL